MAPSVAEWVKPNEALAPHLSDGVCDFSVTSSAFMGVSTRFGGHMHLLLCKFRTVTSFVIVATVSLLSQQGPQPKKEWLSSWREATVSFGTVEQDSLRGKYYKVIGSGIVLSPPNAHTGYIVTAKHVFYDPTKNKHPSELQIRFGWQDQRSVY